MKSWQARHAWDDESLGAALKMVVSSTHQKKMVHAHRLAVVAEVHPLGAGIPYPGSTLGDLHCVEEAYHHAVDPTSLVVVVDADTAEVGVGDHCCLPVVVIAVVVDADPSDVAGEDHCCLPVVVLVDADTVEVAVGDHCHLPVVMIVVDADAAEVDVGERHLVLQKLLEGPRFLLQQLHQTSSSLP